MGKAGESLASDPLLRLVDRIYQGAVDATAWPEILSDVVKYMGCSKGVLVTSFVSPKDGGFAFVHGIPVSFMQQWGDRYLQHDIWTRAAAAKGYFREGLVSLDRDLVPEEELTRSVFFKEFLQPQGIGRLCAAAIFDAETPGSLACHCSVFRDFGEPRFSDSDKQRMQVLLPHLSRALGVMFRLRDDELQTAATLAALDGLASGIALLDALGAVVHLNLPAHRIADQADGLVLGLQARIIAADSVSQTALDASVNIMLRGDVTDAEHFSHSVSVPRPSKKPPFALQFAPLPNASPFSAEAGNVRGIVFITDPVSRPAPDAALLKRLYGISPAEARLATALCGGETLIDAAQRCLISEATARTQLRSCFEKTRTHRQADLVRLLLSIASDSK